MSFSKAWIWILDVGFLIWFSQDLDATVFLDCWTLVSQGSDLVAFALTTQRCTLEATFSKQSATQFSQIQVNP
jgi:hypothetical protein